MKHYKIYVKDITMKEKVFGLDLGSTMSSVAVIENGEAKVIVTSEGSKGLPSVVYLKENEKKVGGSAKRGMVMNPKNTVSFIKRFIGADWTNKDVQKMKDLTTYDVVEESGKPRVKIDNKLYSPEQISSMIVAEAKKMAEDYYGEEVKKCVVTCPAWFDDQQRQATKLAGELAGLEVLRVINEPTAAILASNIDVKTGDKIVAVTDFGGATADVSVVEISDIDGQTMYEVLASHGDVFLGGQNYDNAIIDWICDEFQKDKGVDLRKDQMAYARLVAAAEKAKIELSTATTTDINEPYITAIDGVPQMLTLTLTRAKFEQIIDNLNQKHLQLIKEALQKAGKSVNDIDCFLLVGGTTRIPSLQDAMTKTFNWSLNKSVNPDEAVALGAAIQANILAGGEGAKDLILLDVTPISLGIETAGGVFTKMVEASTTIPTTKKETFSTYADNQPAVEIMVYQGERPLARDNKLLGRFTLDGIMPAPRGVPQIEVSFTVNVDGILEVSATDKATGKEQHIKIDNQNSLTDSEIEQIKADAEKFKAEDDRKIAEINEFNKIEHQVYAIKKAVDDENLGLTEEQKNEVNNKIDDCTANINKRDLIDLKTAFDELNKVWEPIVTAKYGATKQDAGTGMKGNPFENMAGMGADGAAIDPDTIKNMFNKKV